MLTFYSFYSEASSGSVASLMPTRLLHSVHLMTKRASLSPRYKNRRVRRRTLASFASRSLALHTGQRNFGIFLSASVNFFSLINTFGKAEIYPFFILNFGNVCDPSKWIFRQASCAESDKPHYCETTCLRI